MTHKRPFGLTRPRRLAAALLLCALPLALGCAARALPLSEESAALVAYYEPRRAADQAHVDALAAARAGDLAAVEKWRAGIAEAAPAVADFNAAHAGKVTLSVRGPWAVYAPAEGEPRASFLYLHGGGWVVGSARMNEPFLAALAERAQIAVWSLDYPLAPERPFPAAPDACVQAVKELRRRFPDRPLFVGGDSAGGTLALVAGLAAPKSVDGLVLYYPALGPGAEQTPEWAAYRDVILLTDNLMNAFTATYVDDVSFRTNPQASPNLADDASLRALPPILTVAADCDLLAGLSRRFHARLQTLGRGQDERIVVPGSLHGFLSFPTLPQSQRQALDLTLRWLDARLK